MRSLATEFSTLAARVYVFEWKFPVDPETTRFVKGLEKRSIGDALCGLVGLIVKRSIPFVLRRRR